MNSTSHAGKVLGLRLALSARVLALAAAVLTAVAGPAAAGLPDYVYHGMGTLGGNGALAQDINSDGVFAGSSQIAFPTQDHAVTGRYPGALEDLGTMGGIKSTAWAINDRGDVVGNYMDDLGTYHAYILRPHQLPVTVPPLAGSECASLVGINDSGVAVGFSFRFTGGNYRAMIWDPVYGSRALAGLGEVTSFAHAINNAGVVTGQANSQAFRWSQSGGAQTLEGGEAVGSAINNAGVIAGTLIAGDDSRAVIWIDDQPPLVLGTLGAFWSDASGINNLNQVVGGSIRGLREQAYVWSAESGMVALPVPEYTVSSHAYAINDLGWIVGSVSVETPGGTRSSIAVWEPVPEPASLLVLAFGLAAAALSRTRSRTRLCS